jgi:hypothetical protein
MESSDVEGDNEERVGGNIVLGAVACLGTGFFSVFGQGEPWSS